MNGRVEAITSLMDVMRFECRCQGKNRDDGWSLIMLPVSFNGYFYRKANMGVGQNKTKLKIGLISIDFYEYVTWARFFKIKLLLLSDVSQKV